MWIVHYLLIAIAFQPISDAMEKLHAPLVVGILGALVVLAWRVRESRRPVTLVGIIAPPLGMATGLSMFVVPVFRVPCSWAVLSFMVGAVVLAVPLMRTSRLSVEESVVMAERSPAFFLVIIALAAIRIFARQYIAAYLSMAQTASLSYLLALGMISRWRAAMYRDYRRLVRNGSGVAISATTD